MPASRIQVYDAIESERAYQDAKWGGQVNDRTHSPTEWLVFIEDYVSEAKHLLSRNKDEIVRPQVMDIMRKITSMGVACMEVHGAPKREGF